MSPLPVQFTDRWGDQRAGPSYEDCVCWHLLLGAHPRVRAAVADAQQRLARFGGMHMAPARWLHITVLLVGAAAAITHDDMDAMLTRARADLAATPPVTVTLERILYHPEAIALGISPAGALRPILAAAQAATREVTGASSSTEDLGAAWIPHLTISYSTGEQSVAPVIAELGKAIPGCEVTIDQLSLVIQNGPEQLWNWQVAGTARLGGHATTGPRSLRHPEMPDDARVLFAAMGGHIGRAGTRRATGRDHRREEVSRCAGLCTEAGISTTVPGGGCPSMTSRSQAAIGSSIMSCISREPR
jgi:2'-5' RNA ligase